MQRYGFTSTGLIENWKKALGGRSFRLQLVSTFLLLSILLYYLSHFFNFIEERVGLKVNDVILNLFSPVDLSLPIFILIYSAAALCIFNLIGEPKLFLKAIEAYFFILIFRLFTLYLFPLEPPDGIILLKDPFIEQFFYGGVRVTKDLFFSGHVATVCLLYLVNPVKKLNYLYLGVALLVGILIMIQRVHYSFDVFASPLFVWLSWRLASKISYV